MESKDGYADSPAIAMLLAQFKRRANSRADTADLQVHDRHSFSCCVSVKHTLGIARCSGNLSASASPTTDPTDALVCGDRLGDGISSEHK